MNNCGYENKPKNMTKEEYDNAHKELNFWSATNIIEERFLDIIDLVITKARSFPSYSVKTLKEEALQWLRLFNKEDI